MLRKTGKGTLPKAMLRKMAHKVKCASSRSRTPLQRKKLAPAFHEGQIPAVMSIPLMALDQHLLAPLQDESTNAEIQGYHVLPLIVPFGGMPKLDLFVDELHGRTWGHSLWPEVLRRLDPDNIYLSIPK